ncbi:triose-phosphate isomerase [Paenalcaligenes hermetiae]|uniref:Triosephosphate isomerase n=1 Tax=Paenalcaligenes hermetiae TaxID=1157987 RepID=A0ABP9LXU3_9BURK
MTKKRLVMGNWKMHGSLDQNAQLLNQLIADLGNAHSQTDIVVCAPHPYLAQLQQLLSGSPIQWGAQNMSEHEAGAFTGEVSATMLKDFGCQWVLLGHSERRALYGETDTLVLAKTQAALQAGLTPVVCVGETEAEHEQNQTQSVILQQLQQLLELSPDLLRRLVIAYEPVWAIGTGKSASPEQAQSVHAYIRGLLQQAEAPNVRILYGGSVNPTNAADLFKMPDIDGALVGGASLKANDFLSIAAA